MRTVSFTAAIATVSGATEKTIKVLSYTGDGAGSDNPDVAEQHKCFEKDLIPGVTIRGTKQPTINAQTLQGYDVLLMPGGLIGYEQYVDKQAIRDFVKAGGGFYGTCAGAYAGCSSWGADHLTGPIRPELHIPDHNITSGVRNEAIGVSSARCDLYYHVGDSHHTFTADGHKVFPKTQDGVVIDHHNGPAMSPNQATVLATFSDGERSGTTSMLADKYGEGNVLLISPHPEHPHNQNCEIVTRAAAYAGKAIDASSILI